MLERINKIFISLKMPECESFAHSGGIGDTAGGQVDGELSVGFMGRPRVDQISDIDTLCNKNN
jgi:hypothetical protein